MITLLLLQGNFPNLSSPPLAVSLAAKPPAPLILPAAPLIAPSTALDLQAVSLPTSKALVVTLFFIQFLCILFIVI